jgi:hypothetical protein
VIGSKDTSISISPKPQLTSCCTSSQFHSYTMKFTSLNSLAAVFLPTYVAAQLSGAVGPSTTRVQKSTKKICNVLNYGGQASKTADIGPALASAFAACKTGGTGMYFDTCVVSTVEEVQYMFLREIMA